MLECSDPSSLPPEILDAIIDELRDDTKSLLQVSLACKALCTRTRDHLFSVAAMSSYHTQSQCHRLRKLITLSPKLALHFKTLHIAIEPILDGHVPGVYGPLTVIESLVNVTHLNLAYGDWRHMPDTAVSSLQSRSYRTVDIGQHFNFRTMGEVCSLVQNSPDLKRASFMCENHPTPECDFNHYLHRTPAPATLRITDYQDTSMSAEIPGLLKLAISSLPCPFSFSNVHTLIVNLSGASYIVPEHLRQYLALPGTSLKHLHVTHNFKLGSADRLSSTTLDVSGVENIEIGILKTTSPRFARGIDILRWWISNLSVKKVILLWIGKTCG
ncbi:hypothetical protein ARMSODRAFT_802341 [Armillaria solidipes]|uniref:F-box domain-containing protein n=1 Tax=Armillaria solidipes TaxID=1076256 RepID=A0A2H3B8E3_9AGAR|nr:hypothetical protein ARMSODRAFT_802341 [Armillaria solidipes]